MGKTVGLSRDRKGVLVAGQRDGGGWRGCRTYAGDPRLAATYWAPAENDTPRLQWLLRGTMGLGDQLGFVVVQARGDTVALVKSGGTHLGDSRG